MLKTKSKIAAKFFSPKVVGLRRPLLTTTNTRVKNTLFFLVVDDGEDDLTHLLPVDLAGDCFWSSATGKVCRLVVAEFTSRNAFVSYLSL
jgi:hypothetical protein